MTIYGVTGTRSHGKLIAEQQRALDRRQYMCTRKVREYWADPIDPTWSPEVAMPTGFGKGRVIKRLIDHCDHDQCLAIVGTKNLLLDQSREALGELAIDETGDNDFSVLPDVSGRVVLSTWQGLSAYGRRNTKSHTFGLTVVDEAHNTGTRKRIQLLKWLKPDQIVGLTATAHRASGAYKTPENYGFTVVDSMPLPDCINKEWLSPLMGVSINTKVILPKSARKGAAELNQGQLFATLRKHPTLYRRIADDLATRFMPMGMKTVVVVNRVKEEACVIARRLKQLGFKVGLAVNLLAAKQLSDKFVTLDAIQRYKLPHNHPDAIQVLISPQVISEGFDAPATECVVWASPTLSHVRYTQVIGRGARRCRKKRYCLVVDYVYMIEDYGYSYNFAQFFHKENMVEMDGGFMYVGPKETGSKIILPSEFSTGGRIVPVVDLRTPVYPPAGDWLTVYQLTKLVVRSGPWITNFLATDYSGKTEMRRTVDAGQVREHYPPDVVDLIQSLQLHPPAGDWLTVGQIARQVPGYGRDRIVVHIGKYDHLKETRIDAGGNANDHYPPSIVSKFRQKASKEELAGDWLTTNNLCTQLGKNHRWVAEALANDLKLKGEKRRTSRNTMEVHFPPTVVAELKKLSESQKPAGNWLTCRKISAALGINREKTSEILRVHFSDQGEVRIVGRTGRPAVHYAPSVLRKLRKLI